MFIEFMYTIILDLCTSMCMQTRFGMYVTDMHVCLCKLSCTYLEHTQVFCTRVSASSILCACSCIYTSEMKNVSYRAHAIGVFNQVEFELYHDLSTCHNLTSLRNAPAKADQSTFDSCTLSIC